MKVIRVRQRKTKTTRKKDVNIQKSSTLMSQYTPTEASFPPNQWLYSGSPVLFDTMYILFS